MPKYTIKKGYEHLVFSEEGISRLDEATIESDHELDSPYLVVVDKPADQMTAEKPVASPVPSAPVAPAPTPIPAPQPTAPVSAPQPQTQTPQEGAN